jgi:hypothetical protein
LGTAAAQERREVTGPRVAIYNLAGQVTLEPGRGSAVTVEVTRGGADGRQLTIEQGAMGDRETLRIIYPSDDIRYPDLRYRGSTELRVREDGTFGDDKGHGFRRREGHQVRISSRGDFEGYADLKIGVPQGQRIEVFLAVGKLSATNVHGDLRLDAAGANVTVTGGVGPLAVDVGSGDVSVHDVQGDVSLDTGSGDVDVSGVRGGVLHIETGSGGATVTSVSGRLLDIDTGSGDVEVSGATAEEVKLDTGSGEVRCELTSNPRHIDVDTGSGGVTLTLPPTYGATLEVESGSGGVDVDFPVSARRVSSDHLSGTIGDGRGTLRIDTGSGGVRIRRSASR